MKRARKPKAGPTRTVQHEGSGGPQLVWSGPEASGRLGNTRRVYEELFGSARRSLWVCSFVYDDGPDVFRRLAQHLDGISRGSPYIPELPPAPHLTSGGDTLLRYPPKDSLRSAQPFSRAKMDSRPTRVRLAAPARVVRRYRWFGWTLHTLAAVVWASACGEGATEPPPSPPESRRATTVTVTPATAELTALGATVQLTAQVLDQNGQQMAGAAVTWSSDIPSVATVDGSGLATAANGNGTAMITATSASASGSAAVTVVQVAAAVTLAPPADTLLAGDTLRLSAEAWDANGNAVAGAEFSWTSSDTGVAVVDDSGRVTAIVEGAATITAISGDASGTSEVTVWSDRAARAALVALYEAADGPNWVNSENWLTDVPLGDWYGVDTDGLGRVLRLDLQGRWEDGRLISHGLSGTIPSDLGNLANLQELYLRLNDLSGSIPSELGGLANLQVLYLDFNDLSGPIPSELGGLTNLKELGLDSNDLSGPIPPQLGNLANLERLILNSNDLSGPVPPQLGNLANLERLDLHDNELSGPIPPELGKLANLERLDLRYNDLSGPVPSELGDLANLSWLILTDNNLSGPIPSSFLQLNRLRNLFLDGNSLCVPKTAAFAAWLQGIPSHDVGLLSYCSG